MGSVQAQPAKELAQSGKAGPADPDPGRLGRINAAAAIKE